MRNRELDIARGLAIVFMVAVHSMFAVYDGSCDALYKMIDFLGSAPAAPVFMFIMGMNMVSSRHSSPELLFRRGFKIFVLSFLFNAVCHALPFFIVDAVTASSTHAVESLHWLSAVDILTFAGMAMMLAGGVKRVGMKPVVFFVISVVMLAVGTVLNKCCTIDYESHKLLASVASLFWSASEPGYFPLLTWTIYPAAGMLMGDILSKKDAQAADGLWKCCLIGGGVVFAVMATLFICLDSIHVPYYADEFVYYRNGAFLCILNMSFVLFWISTLHFLCKRCQKAGTGIFLRWSRNLTPIYVCQWFLINFLLVVPFNANLSLGPVPFLAAVALIIALSDLLAVGYKKFKARENEGRA